MKQRLAGWTAVVLILLMVPLAWGQEQKRIAVFPFTTSAGIVQFWEGNFNPGEAMTAIVQDLLTKSSRYAVYDRANLDKIAQEQNLGIGGQVTPETAAQVGRLTGVQYLLTGAIVEFAATKQSGAGGLSIPGIPVFGGSHSQRFRCTVEAHLTNVNTGQISAGLRGSAEEVTTSLAVAGFVPGVNVGAAVESSEFANSGLGKAMYKAAEDVVNQLDTVQFHDVPALPQLEGQVIYVDGDQYTLNIGSKSGVVKGMKFTVTRTKHIVDPVSNKPRDIHEPVGSMTVIAVDDDTCTCKAGPSTAIRLKDTAKLER